MRKKRRRLKRGPIIITALILCLVIFCFNINYSNKTKKLKNVKISDKEVAEVKNIKKSMSLVMVGDTLIHDSIYKDAYVGDNNYDFKSMFTDVGELIKDYDLKYYNQD